MKAGPGATSLSRPQVDSDKSRPWGDLAESTAGRLRPTSPPGQQQQATPGSPQPTSTGGRPRRRRHRPRSTQGRTAFSSSSSGSHPFLGRPFLSACFALRRAPRPPARKNALASAHTDDRRTDDATCGPQAWLTGTLHEGGIIRSVRSPPRRAPLLATPIAKPLQCGRP